MTPGGWCCTEAALREFFDEITRRALGDAGGTAPSAPLDRAAEELRTEGLL